MEALGFYIFHRSCVFKKVTRKTAFSTNVANALHPDISMNWTQVIGLFAGICTSTSLLPQLIKTIKEKKAEEISKAMLFTLMTGVATWVVYGVLRNDLPIILTNSFSLLLNIILVFFRFKYSRNKGRQPAVSPS